MNQQEKMITIRYPLTRNEELLTYTIIFEYTLLGTIYAMWFWEVSYFIALGGTLIYNGILFFIAAGVGTILINLFN